VSQQAFYFIYVLIDPVLGIYKRSISIVDSSVMAYLLNIYLKFNKLSKICPKKFVMIG